MKFPKGINKIFLFLFFLEVFTSCSLFNINKNQPNGTWQYVSVTRGNQSIFEILKTDTLQISADGSFNYFIQKPGKIAHGNWKLIPVSMDSNARNALVFSYFPNGNKRIFNIEKLSKNKMVLREHNLYFRFQRIR